MRLFIGIGLDFYQVIGCWVEQVNQRGLFSRLITYDDGTASTADAHRDQAAQ